MTLLLPDGFEVATDDDLLDEDIVPKGTTLLIKQNNITTDRKKDLPKEEPQEQTEEVKNDVKIKTEEQKENKPPKIIEGWYNVMRK